MNNKIKAYQAPSFAPVVRTVHVEKGLGQNVGRAKVLKKVQREYGGDYRGLSYDPKTGKGTAV